MQQRNSKFILITSIIVIFFVIFAFGTAAYVQPHRQVRYVKPLVIFHIILTMSWLFVFFVQSNLIQKKSIEIHKRNAILGYLLVPIITVQAIYLTYLWGSTERLIGESRDVLAFAALFFWSIRVAKKEDFEAHKRYMLFAVLNLLNPAITRVVIIFEWSGPVSLLLLLLVVFIVPISFDLLSRKSIHKATIYGITFTIISILLMIGVVVSPLNDMLDSFLYSK